MNLQDENKWMVEVCITAAPLSDLNLGKQFIFDKSHNNLSAYFNSAGLKELQTSAPLLDSGFRLRGIFGQSGLISESVCSYWLLYTALLCDL